MSREFEINIEPKGKGRPRTRIVKTGRRSFAQIYTPKDTREYEQTIRDAYDAAAFDHNWEPYAEHVPIRICVECGMSIPKSTSKRKREAMAFHLLYPTKRPDTDNLVKSVMDALNGLAFHDDAQIVELKVLKVYADPPYVRVSLSEVNV